MSDRSQIQLRNVTDTKKIIERYGSIMEIGEATAGELTLIEGVGPTIAQRIIDTLNSEDRVIV